MEDEDSNSFWSKLFRRKNEEEVLEQEVTDDAYKELKRLLMRAKPEIKGENIIVHLPKADIVLKPRKLVIRAPTRKDAEKVLRNLHYYSQPPGLWPAYGLTYSIRKERERAS